MRIEVPYNPLDKKNLGVSVADALLARPLEPLPPSEAFLGAGIYAIYYSGSFPAYTPIADATRQSGAGKPVYVGKAIPSGGRRGGLELDAAVGPVLYRRLVEHADSISLAANLELEDFSCRFLVVDDIWISLGESLLISMHRPIWNVVIDGFGNHDPGAGRYNQKVSAWDVLHPGRPWAVRLRPNPKTVEQLLAEVESHFATSA